MRFVCVLSLVCGLLAGCRGPASREASLLPSTAGATWTEPQVIVTPGSSLSGTVARVNPQGTYAIMSFPIGSVPAVNQYLEVFRNGLKVGDIKVTGPQREYNIAGDLVAGQAQAGDEVRQK